MGALASHQWTCAGCNRSVDAGPECPWCASDRDANRAAMLAALQWCRVRMETLFAAAQVARDDARRQHHADIRLLSWSATELVAWLGGADTGARALLNAVQAVRRGCPRTVTSEPDVLLLDPRTVLNLLPAPGPRDQRDGPHYGQWEALCNMAGLDEYEAEALLFYYGMHYRLTDAAQLTGLSHRQFRRNLMIGEQKINALLEGQHGLTRRADTDL